MDSFKEKKYRMNVAASLNSKYMRYAYVLATSLLLNQPKEAEVHFYFLNRDLTETDRDHLAALLASYGGEAHFLQVEEGAIPAECPVSDGWTVESYFRLLLGELLPEDVDRILFLDIDIIVNCSLEELYFTDFEGKLICASADDIKYPFQDDWDYFFRLQIQNKFRYFNSGVMLIDMALLREKYKFTDYMEIAEKYDYKMCMPDQDLLNYLHWNEVKFLDHKRYNVFAKIAYQHGMCYADARQTVAILHFTGAKPWQGQYVHYDIEKLWWDYAKKTPFYEELMEEYRSSAIWNPMVYDTMFQLHEEKKVLKEELEKISSLCKKIFQMFQENPKG